MAKPLIEDWAHLPWRKLERVVYRLQTRIFRASARGNVRVVHSLQRLLMKSEAARCLAVRLLHRSLSRAQAPPNLLP
jgi:RNA-directed DNA polymerase